MYRLLEVGEVIEKGDEYYGLEDKWLGFPPSCVGMKTVPHDAPIRRLIKPAVTPAASSVPDPVVSVGDRVKVLSGPWAGCTGVVRSLDYPQGRTVVMDNVFVGGDRLIVIVQGKDLERLPPVVTEVLFRDLAIGEVIRQGDEVESDVMGWRPSCRIGQTQERFHFPARRPVRLQSPGWRYLDAGETVQAGDETEYSFAPFWRDARLTMSFGYPVLEGHDKYFRRKLPANQGG